jgi:RHS repeat-associated protein
VIYLGRDGVRLYFNQSGNALSAPLRLRSLPPVHSLASLSVVDLLGQGTACLVRSSPVPGGEPAPLAYVDVLGGQKPHLLTSVSNNLGGETRIAYASSTTFYLRDKAAGRPWLTRLSFPVHVIERIERVDHVARSKLVTRFAYHHGFFDGHEREFRGFACVEQWDAESFGGEKGKGLFPELPYDVDPADPELNLPPVRTVTWFHTGAWLERERLERALANEYYAHDPAAPLLPDTILPPGLSIAEQREAARALRGSILRQEIYAEDATPDRIHPYSVSERSYAVRLLHHAVNGRRAVFFVHPRETVDLHYERRPDDPRMQHQVVLEVDDFGSVTQSATLGYPRRAPEHPEQARLWAVVSDQQVSNRPDETDWYRVGVPLEATTSELTGLTPPAQGLLSPNAIRAAITAAAEIPYEATASEDAIERRAVERQRTLYDRDDLTGPLPFGVIESRAIPYETQRQAFTPGLLAQVYGDRVDDAILGAGRYIHQDDAWWAPSGRLVPDPERFYLPIRAIDPFGQQVVVRYDDYSLLVTETDDPIGNRVTAANDYRVLAPALITDPNGNRTAVAFDAVGLVVASAVMGKIGANEGDTLDDPTTRLEYDLHRWRDSQRPAVVRTLAREQHGAANPRWQESYTYADGSGREVMKKVQAEPGLVPVLDEDGRIVRNSDGTPQMVHTDSRWVGTGRTVFDNKGNPVKKYEPFFTDTFEYEDERDLVEWGVTPILRYDPLGRLVRVDQPNGAHTRVVFDAWTRETWDENDAVAGTPWLVRKQAGTPAEQRCAALALAHAGTPTIAHLDPLGRVFLTIADNGPAGQVATRVELDVEGNALSVTDARGIRTAEQTFDVLGRPIHTSSPDAGDARALPDVADKPVYSWTARGQALRRAHDALQRPTHLFVRLVSDEEILVERMVYGEAHPDAEALNLRGRPHAIFDGAGVLLHERFDFKGNPVEVTRRLAADYHQSPDWSPLAALLDLTAIHAAAAPLLDAEAFSTTVAFDALNRVVSRTTPDGSETRPTYNEASLLERLDVRIRGAETWTSFLQGIDYNARGQRERVEHGNGGVCEYQYDPETFRLIRQRTTRVGDSALLQDLAYEHDPVGNLVQITDAVSFGNPTVSADGLYEYDALYQLVRAEGREHPGQQPTDADAPLLRVDHPNDLGALRRYRETYAYDPVGNLTEVAHLPLAPGSSGWTRRYQIASDSNRLLATSLPGDPPDTFSAVYAHDAHGNMTAMPHLAEMRWDHADRLQSADRLGGGSVTFAYDSAGQRVRKAYDHGAHVEERIYLGDYEIYRKRHLGTGEVELERETLHVLDAGRLVALVETKTIDTSTPGHVPTPRLRVQLANHLGSTAFELDETGAVITYEEFFPFGGTSWRAAHSATEVSARRYRYTGKERDEETGLHDHGARYYAAWIGRWTSADPAGFVDGTNLYRYARNNPVGLSDPSGSQSEKCIEQIRVTTEYDANDRPILDSTTKIKICGGRWSMDYEDSLGTKRHLDSDTTEVGIIGGPIAPPVVERKGETRRPVRASARTKPATRDIAAIGPNPAHIDTSISPENLKNILAMGPSGLGIASMWNALADPFHAWIAHTAAIADSSSQQEALVHAVKAQQSLQEFQGQVALLVLPALTAGGRAAAATKAVAEGGETAANLSSKAAGAAATSQEASGLLGKSGETFEILDGVRRAKAAAELGNATIRAEVMVGDRVVQTGDVALSSLRSPFKSAIDVSNPSLMGRWLRILQGTRAGDPLPPIQIQPGSTGVTLEQIIFLFFKGAK